MRNGGRKLLAITANGNWMFSPHLLSPFQKSSKPGLLACTLPFTIFTLQCHFTATPTYTHTLLLDVREYESGNRNNNANMTFQKKVNS